MGAISQPNLASQEASPDRPVSPRADPGQTASPRPNPSPGG